MTFNPGNGAATSAKIGSLGLTFPKILIPHTDVDLGKWAVVACDQFTAQPDYWLDARKRVGDLASTLDITLPEYYLEHPGETPVEQRIARINQTMQDYLDKKVLTELEPGWMVIDRQTPYQKSRKGVVLAVDLEQYDFTPGNNKLIRATEGTVLDRIPPRLAIRKDAPLELPHVQLLIDDPDRSVIEPLFTHASSQPPRYETDLMLGGGHIRGWFVPASSAAAAKAVDALSRLESLTCSNLLFAVGDGNHSLATAQAHWHRIRDKAAPDHPARYALVEVINIHDKGLEFEPIHRAVWGIGLDEFIEQARHFFECQLLETLELDPDDPAAQPSETTQVQIIPVFSQDRCILMKLSAPVHSLAAGTLQALLDKITDETSARVDYIHGADVTRKLADDGNLGILLPAMQKQAFFPLLAREGILPRKTFSMGEAVEKRYYIECRKIR